MILLDFAVSVVDAFYVLQVLTDQLGFVESHKLIDGRLALCSVAVGFALFALIWDYLYPFPRSQAVLIISVISYPFIQQCKCSDTQLFDILSELFCLC